MNTNKYDLVWLMQAATTTLIAVFVTPLAWPCLSSGFSLQKTQFLSPEEFMLNIVAMAHICLPVVPFYTLNHAQHSVISAEGWSVLPLEALVSEDLA
jgi:hypothetical protein